jgi:hexosaminidase
MRKLTIALIASVCSFSFTPDLEKQKVLIIPQPESIDLKKGHFTFNAGTRLFIPEEFLKDLGTYVKKKMMNDAGITVSAEKWDHSASKNFILFDKTDDPTLGNEGYQLEISSGKIVGKANTYAGIFNAFQSLRQVIPPNARQFPEKSVRIPCLIIKDHPRFEWRGVMLDVSRHFRPKEFVLKQIDIFSSYKINKFHWHLSDDQGWRVEIKKYPNLTIKGAWRADRTGIAWWSREPAKPEEPKTIGGYYTQQDIKEIVEYARVRNIEVIPEIDVPGHSQALVAAYPSLFCFKDDYFEVNAGGKTRNNVLCAGKETTYQMLGEIIAELTELFPSKYIHVGGDEAGKKYWEKCPDCQNRIKENNLKNLDELQSYFTSRLNELINSRGKILIGWDEIMQGKDTKGAMVMAWRVDQNFNINAPRAGYKTIMASYRNSYLDFKQGPNEFEPLGVRNFLPISKAYHYDPIPRELTTEEAKLVLGTQVNLWGEFIPTDKHGEYMLYPRVLANAEVAWCKPEAKDWSRFQKAIELNFQKFDRDGINYSKSLYNIYATFAPNLVQNKVLVHLLTETVGYDIYYTINGDEPSVHSNKYGGVFTADPGAKIKSGLFDHTGKLLGKLTEIVLK